MKNPQIDPKMKNPNKNIHSNKNPPFFGENDNLPPVKNFIYYFFHLLDKNIQTLPYRHFF